MGKRYDRIDYIPHASIRMRARKAAVARSSAVFSKLTGKRRAAPIPATSRRSSTRNFRP